MSDAASSTRRNDLEEALEAWANPLGARFAWEPDRQITYTRSRGAWHLSTRDVNGRDDWISVHPHADGMLETQLVAEAGHVEVTRLKDDELAGWLDTVLAFFESWTRFMSEGPGRGH